MPFFSYLCTQNQKQHHANYHEKDRTYALHGRPFRRAAERAVGAAVSYQRQPLQGRQQHLVETLSRRACVVDGKDEACRVSVVAERTGKSRETANAK